MGSRSRVVIEPLSATEAYATASLFMLALRETLAEAVAGGCGAAHVAALEDEVARLQEENRLLRERCKAAGH